LALKRSIEKVVGHENYEWQTLRVQEDGKVKVEWLSSRCFSDIVGQIPVGDQILKNIWIELEPIFQKGMGFCF